MFDEECSVVLLNRSVPNRNLGLGTVEDMTVLTLKQEYSHHVTIGSMLVVEELHGSSITAIVVGVGEVPNQFIINAG